MKVWKAAVLAATTAMWLASCGVDSREADALASSAWKEQIQAAQDEALQRDNQMLLSVLDDGAVSEAELMQVVGVFDKCLVAAGFEGGGVLLRLEGGLNVQGEPPGLGPEEQRARVDECAQTSGIDLLDFAVQQRSNPLNQDMVVVSSRCMKARGLIQHEYVAAEIDQFIAEIESLSAEDKEKAAECNLDPHRFL